LTPIKFEKAPIEAVDELHQAGKQGVLEDRSLELLECAPDVLAEIGRSFHPDSLPFLPYSRDP